MTDSAMTECPSCGEPTVPGAGWSTGPEPDRLRVYAEQVVASVEERDPVDVVTEGAFPLIDDADRSLAAALLSLDAALDNGVDG